MPDEKIPCWARKIYSLLNRNTQLSSDAISTSPYHLLRNSEKKNPSQHIRKERQDYSTFFRIKGDSYRFNSLLFAKITNWQSQARIQSQPLQIPLNCSKRIVSLAIFLSLSWVYSSCTVHLHSRHPAVQPLPVGGVLPNSPADLPQVLPSRMGRKLWFDNRRGTNSVTDLPTTAMYGFCHPLQGKGFLSQGTSGSTHQGRMKYAYDFGVPIGMPVYAMQSGRVIGVRDVHPDRGGRRKNAEKFNYIWLEHSNGVRSAYIHLQQNFRRKIPLKLYDWVKTGQLIGYSGNSGWSTAPHLHVEVHSISNSGFGQTLPFVINAKCYTSPYATVSTSS